MENKAPALEQNSIRFSKEISTTKHRRVKRNPRESNGKFQNKHATIMRKLTTHPAEIQLTPTFRAQSHSLLATSSHHNDRFCFSCLMSEPLPFAVTPPSSWISVGVVQKRRRVVPRNQFSSPGGGRSASQIPDRMNFAASPESDSCQYLLQDSGQKRWYRNMCWKYKRFSA